MSHVPGFSGEKKLSVIENSMDRKALEALKRWFSSYAGSFVSSIEEDRRNLGLKVEHTGRVCADTLSIGRAEGLSPEELLVAEAAALLHDVGRFPQYARFRSFYDSMTVNHGELGARVLVEEGVLDVLPPKERDTVLAVVRYHNAFGIPGVGDERTRTLMKLVRDADKLDIFRVDIEYGESPAEERSSAVTIGLPDISSCSPDVLRRIQDRRKVPLSAVRSINDYRLMHLSWVFDFNFRASYGLLLNRGYIDRIAAFLPSVEEVKEAIGIIKAFAGKAAGA